MLVSLPLHSASVNRQSYSGVRRHGSMSSNLEPFLLWTPLLIAAFGFLFAHSRTFRKIEKVLENRNLDMSSVKKPSFVSFPYQGYMQSINTIRQTLATSLLSSDVKRMHSAAILFYAYAVSILIICVAGFLGY